MTQSHIYIALTNAVRGREEEFNTWYTNYHMPEIIDRLPGFVSGRRFELNGVQRPWPDGRQIEFPFRHAAIYQIELDDIDSIDRELGRIRSAKPLTSDGGALDPVHRGWVYTPTGQHAESAVARSGPEYLLAAFTNPVKGREQDFDGWYGPHLREWVEWGPGYKSATRYKANPRQRAGMDAPWQSLALYDLEFEDVDRFHREEVELMRSGNLTSADGAMDSEKFWVWLMRPITPVMEG